jgi:hypothetical protein
MKSLAEVSKQGRDAKRFAETFALEVHQGRWDQAEDHWERTVAEFLNTKEMEGLSARRATEQAQRLAMATLWFPAKRWGTCPWCSRPGRQDKTAGGR